MQNIAAYARLMRLHTPVGSLLLLWPTLWALWIASQGHPNLYVLTVLVVGTVLMRSAGCVINDWADRAIDGRVQRTQDRPLVTGAVTPRAALVLCAFLLLAAFALVLTLDRFTILLALAAGGWALLYPFTKRWFFLPQLILGIAFSWGTLIAFSAQTHQLPPVAWYLFAITLLWTMAYDTWYAMSDKPEDQSIGIHSSALWLGGCDWWSVLGLYSLVLVLLCALGLWYHYGAFYQTCIATAALLAGYQCWLAKNKDPARCLQAFKYNHWMGLIVFLGLLKGY